jgi:hypothetical protein
MLLAELEGIMEEQLDAVAMGNSFKDTKHMCYILRGYRYFRARIKAKRILIQWIQTLKQITDICTKINTRPHHKILTDLIHIAVKVLTQIQEG